MNVSLKDLLIHKRMGLLELGASSHQCTRELGPGQDVSVNTGKIAITRYLGGLVEISARADEVVLMAIYFLKEQSIKKERGHPYLAALIEHRGLTEVELVRFLDAHRLDRQVFAAGDGRTVRSANGSCVVFRQDRLESIQIGV